MERDEGGFPKRLDVKLIVLTIGGDFEKRKIQNEFWTRKKYAYVREAVLFPGDYGVLAADEDLFF